MAPAVLRIKVRVGDYAGTPWASAAIARRAANARWGVDDPRHTLCAGSLRLDGGIVIACAVLDDKKTRVLSQRGFAETIGAAKPSGRNRRGDGELPAFLSAANLKAFITNDLVATAKPIEYYPEHGGRTALGIRAEAIVPLLRVWVNADDAARRSVIARSSTFCTPAIQRSHAASTSRGSVSFSAVESRTILAAAWLASSRLVMRALYARANRTPPLASSQSEPLPHRKLVPHQPVVGGIVPAWTLAATLGM